jgi:hypothetical protein
MGLEQGCKKGIGGCIAGGIGGAIAGHFGGEVANEFIDTINVGPNVSFDEDYGSMSPTDVFDPDPDISLDSFCFSQLGCIDF